MHTVDTTFAEWLAIIRNEFAEMPGLVLTRPQMQRLWGMDAVTCDRALAALVASQFLIRLPDGNYARSSSAS